MEARGKRSRENDRKEVQPACERVNVVGRCASILNVAGWVGVRVADWQGGGCWHLDVLSVDAGRAGADNLGLRGSRARGRATWVEKERRDGAGWERQGAGALASDSPTSHIMMQG